VSDVPDRNSDGTLSILLISSVFLAFPAWAGDVEVQLGAGDGFVIKDNTGALERLRVDEATGNVSRNGALFVHTTGGSNNTFVGEGAGNLSTTGSSNSAFGRNALGSNANGLFNSAFGKDALFSNGSGQSNSAFGRLALEDNTSGGLNSAFGAGALANNTTAFSNSAFGASTLFTNTTGVRNSALGQFAMSANDTGSDNSAFGHSSLRSNTVGARNVALGKDTLQNNSTGSDNIAVGAGAGSGQVAGVNTIYIANDGANESGVIRIGTSGTHVSTFVAGVSGVTVSGVSVLVSGTGQLGVATSSLRFKHAVRDMGDSSGMLKSLRPVTFRYREEYVGPDDTTHFGLIAEEVAKVAPGLVYFDDEGRPFSVRYEFLTPLLLNEVQKQQRTLEAQQARIGVQAAAIESQTAKLAQQQELIAAVLARIERLEASPQLAWAEPIR
jgi:hypothetical protein